MGKGNPGAGEDALDPGPGLGAVEEVGNDDRLAVTWAQRMRHAIAEAHGRERPQRQRTRAGLDIAQCRRQGLLDLPLIVGAVARKLDDAVAEDQRPDQRQQQQQADPEERRAKDGGPHGSWHVTISAKTG